MLRLCGTICLIAGSLLPGACSKSTPATSGSSKGENKPTLSKEDATKEDLKRLEAPWTAVLDEEEGRKYRGRGDGMLIDGQEIQFLWGSDHRVARAKFTIDPSKEPKEIHLVYVQGSEINQKRPGIYRFSGDQLQICWGPLQAAQPPPKFSGELEPDSGRLMTYLPPNKAAAFQPPTNTEDTYASLGQGLIDTAKEIVKVLKTVKDGRSAVSALRRLQDLKAKSETLGKLFEKLGDPSSKQDQQQVQQYVKEYGPIEAIMEAEVARLKKVKGAEAIIMLLGDKK